MRPTTLLYALALVALLPPVAGSAADLRRISALMSSPESCERQTLLDFLRHDDVRVRSAALDLLETVTGRDFGLDPWLPPAEVPQAVQQALSEWAAAEELVGDAAKAPEPAQLADAVVLLRAADPDTQRRICLRFAPWKSALATALLAELQQNKQLTERETDNLRCSLFRLQLQDSMPAEVGQVAPLLTSHARKDILAGLEALRKCGRDALPVLMEFTDSADGLVREVAIDVLLQTGRAQAYKILMPRLMAEQDRNILQIAARRAPDCTPLPQIITFLNHCAALQDEDVVVAALEALADMEADDDDDDDDKKSAEKLAGAEQAMEMELCLGLLKSPNWRVRAAMLRALQSTESFTPSIRNEELQRVVLASLRDDDETVRLHAMQVLHKRKLAGSFSAELSEFAVSTPSVAPYVVYFSCRQKSELSPALIDVVSRFSPEQVDMLIHYEEEYETVFNTSDRLNQSAMKVVEALLSNPDPRVRYRVMPAWGRNLYCQRTDWAESFVDWLQDPSVPGIDKIEPLRLLVFRTSERDRRRGCDERLAAWLQQESESPTLNDAALQQGIYAALLNLRPAMVPAPDTARLQQLSPELLSCVIENRPELILSLEPEFAAKLLVHDDFTSFHELMTARRDRVAIRQLLSTIKLREHQWESLITGEFDAEMDDDEVKPTSGIIRRILQAAGDKPDFRVLHTAYLILCLRPDMEPELVSAVIAAAPEPQRIALECLREAPRTAEAVEPWARKYRNSTIPAVRRAVAGCLLPTEGWLFYLPRTGELPPLATTSMREWDGDDAKRASCPVSLIRLVQSMQADEDPAVAFIACCSMLYRTGDCDRARMSELLNHVAAWRENYLRSDDENQPEVAAALEGEYAACRSVVGSVWRRWYEYRSGINEFFKLKGSPKKLRPGLEKLLGEIVEKTGSTPWSLIEEVKGKIPTSRSSSSGKELDIQAHEFDYPSSPVTAAPTAPEPLPEPADEADADEPEPPAPPADVTAPVRVEFFHKKGCDVCERVQKQLDELKSEFPGLEVVSYDVESEAGRECNTVLSARFDVPRADRRKAPSLFAAAGCLLGEAAAERSRLEGLLRESRAIGGQITTPTATPEPAEQGPQDAPSAPEPVSDTPHTPNPAPPTTPPPADRLAAATATETAAAAGEQIWERVRSYGVLALGGLLTLLGGCLVLFSRSKGEQ